MLYIKFQPNIILGWGVVLKYGRLTDVIYAFLALYNFFFGRKHNNETFQLLTVLYTYYRGWHKSIVCTNFNYVKLSRCANLPKHHPPLFRNKRFILDEITYLVKRFKIGHILEYENESIFSIPFYIFVKKYVLLHYSPKEFPGLYKNRINQFFLKNDTDTSH